jgi:hypothetical protein
MLTMSGYGELVQRIRSVVRATPPQATVIIASHGNSELLQLDGRRGWHLP